MVKKVSCPAGMFRGYDQNKHDLQNRPVEFLSLKLIDKEIRDIVRTISEITPVWSSCAGHASKEKKEHIYQIAVGVKLHIESHVNEGPLLVFDPNEYVEKALRKSGFKVTRRDNFIIPEVIHPDTGKLIQKKNVIPVSTDARVNLVGRTDISYEEAKIILKTVWYNVRKNLNIKKVKT